LETWKSQNFISKDDIERIDIERTEAAERTSYLIGKKVWQSFPEGEKKENENDEVYKFYSGTILKRVWEIDGFYWINKYSDDETEPIFPRNFLLTEGVVGKYTSFLDGAKGLVNVSKEDDPAAGSSDAGSDDDGDGSSSDAGSDDDGDGSSSAAGAGSPTRRGGGDDGDGSSSDSDDVPKVTKEWIRINNWTTVEKKRANGKADKYYSPPDGFKVPEGFKGKKKMFRSRPDVERFLRSVVTFGCKVPFIGVQNEINEPPWTYSTDYTEPPNHDADVEQKAVEAAADKAKKDKTLFKKKEKTFQVILPEMETDTEEIIIVPPFYTNYIVTKHMMMFGIEDNMKNVIKDVLKKKKIHAVCI
jgi:hypothetical protein